MPHPDMNANGGHPDEGLLHEWLDDQLSPIRAAEMQAHIAGCAACGARVAEARGLIAASHRILSALDEVPSDVIPINFSVASNAESNSADMPSDGIVSIDTARNAAPAAAPRRVFSWQRVAPIAALLLVGVMLARSGFRNDTALKSEDFRVPSAVSESAAAPAAAAPAAVATGDATPPANSADRVADGPTSAPRAEARRSAALPEQVTPAPTASARQAKAAKASEPQQVASATSDARRSASASAKTRSATVVADSAIVASAPPGSAAGAPVPAVALAPLPLLTADQMTARADATGRVTAAGGGRGGRGGSVGGGVGVGGRSGGRSTAEPPTMVANAAASGTVSNATSVGASMASAPSAGAPLASSPAPAARDSSGRRAALETGQRALAQGQRVTDPSDSTAARSTLQLRGLFIDRAVGMTITPAPAVVTTPTFDSVTVERTECSPACELTSLHVDALGMVRYTVGTGNAQRSISSQLTAVQRSQLRILMTQSFSNSLLHRGRTVCSSPPATRERQNPRDAAPELQLLLDMPGSATLRLEQRCAKSVTELREIGARVDAIAGTDALKRKLPPRL